MPQLTVVSLLHRHFPTLENGSGLGSLFFALLLASIPFFLSFLSLARKTSVSDSLLSLLPASYLTVYIYLHPILVSFSFYVEHKHSYLTL